MLCMLGGRRTSYLSILRNRSPRVAVVHPLLPDLEPKHVNVAQAPSCHCDRDQFSSKEPCLSPKNRKSPDTNMEATAPAAHEASPLPRLPPELRNEIYQLVIEPGTPIIFEDGKLMQPELSLISVCHELRKDCLPIIRHFFEQAD